MKKLYIFTFAILGFLNSFSQCSGRYQNNIFTNVDVTTVQYGSNVDLGGTTINLQMDIYQPQGDTGTNRSVILFAHGGSFSAGTKTNADMVYMATEFAKKGYVCASIDYRLATSAFSLISEETTFKVVFDAIQDGKAAVRFFRKDAATTNTYKINSDQIMFGGLSAGGILAMNLAYLDTVTDLSAQWQTWMGQIGGIEGASGNPGYCSKVSGTFGFSGAVADTSWIDTTDVPWYGSHALGDQTVQFGFGQPLNGFTPISLYGSGPINTRMQNIGVYHHLDQYSGSDHPAFANSTQIRTDNKDSLAVFLYNISDCNPNNLQKTNQKKCSTSTTTVSVQELNTKSNENIMIYPNPFGNELSIQLDNNYINNTKITIINSLGKIVKEQNVNTQLNIIELSNFPKGIYFVRITSPFNSFSKKIIKN